MGARLHLILAKEDSRFQLRMEADRVTMGLILASFSIVLFQDVSLAAEAREADIEALFKSGVFWSVSFSCVYDPYFLSPETFVFLVCGWSSV